MNWTKEQKKLINLNNDGNFVVKACPGSGKTTCICERIFNLLHEWEKPNSGIAVLSFTNVAKNEIIKKIENEDFSLNIGYPHYFGTLDSFFNKFIFLPFGHLVMGCDKRPELVGDPFNHWTGTNDIDYFFDKTTFNSDGDIIDREKTDFYPKEDWKWKQIFEMKHHLKREGFATQKDANFHAMKVLQEYPKIAKALTLRFPSIIIDEAQDTSEIQMRIIEILIQNGLKNIILVGDPEQGIYEWNTANPKLLESKFNNWKKSITFKYNFRSSQKICNFFLKLSNLDRIKSCVDFQENYNPKIIPHKNNFDEIIQNFLKDCEEKSINVSKDSVAILFRSKDEPKKFNLKNEGFSINEIFVGTDYFMKSYSRNIILANYFLYNNDYLNSFKEFEKAFIKLKYGDLNFINKRITDEKNILGIVNYRKNIFNFIKKFPNIIENQNIEEWILNINKNLKENENPLNEISVNKNHKNISKYLTFDNLFVEDFDGNNNHNFYLGTIHSVKGESFDAVLLILKNKGSENIHYKTHLINNTVLMDSEELRIIYVGMSRARKLLHVAVPKDTVDFWKNKFLNNSIQTNLFNFET